jgi:hypothetical protein
MKCSSWYEDKDGAVSTLRIREQVNNRTIDRRNDLGGCNWLRHPERMTVQSNGLKSKGIFKPGEQYHALPGTAGIFR